MADQVLTTLLAQTFRDVGGVLSTGVAVTDSFSSNRGCSPGASGLYYRVFAAKSAWTGSTKATPKDLLAAVQSAANAGPGAAYWGVTLRPTGAVRVTYNGGTGAAAWVWTSTALRNLLGFSGTLNFSAPGQYVEGTVYTQPLFCVFSHNARKNSTGMVPVPRRMAIGQLDDGSQYAWTASRAGATWTADLATHPFDTAAKTALNANAVCAPGTILWPSDTARIQIPVGAPASSLAGPWSLHDFFNTVPGSVVGAYFGNFQAALSSAAEVFYDVRIERETLMRRDAVAPTRAHFSRLIDWRQVQYTLNGVRDRL